MLDSEGLLSAEEQKLLHYVFDDSKNEMYCFIYYLQIFNDSPLWNNYRSKDHLLLVGTLLFPWIFMDGHVKLAPGVTCARSNQGRGYPTL